MVLFRPWRSESHVLTAHLIENEQRGEMTFWDKACGIVALKSRFEAEQGRTLTLRPLEDALHALGLAVNTATLGLHLFATERLRTLGEAVTDLSGLDVKTMQPRLNALKRHYTHAIQTLNSRLVSIYESGTPTTLDFVLGASSIDDMLESLHFMTLVGKEDRRIVAEVKRSKVAMQASRLETRAIREKVIGDKRALPALRAAQQRECLDQLKAALLDAIESVEKQ